MQKVGAKKGSGLQGVKILRVAFSQNLSVCRFIILRAQIVSSVLLYIRSNAFYVMMYVINFNKRLI